MTTESNNLGELTPTTQSEVKRDKVQRPLITLLALFSSTATLLCCALPAALATIAGGAAVSAFVSAVPWLIPLSRYKDGLFLTAGFLLLLSAWLTFRPQGRLACALTGGRGCEVAGRWTKIVLGVSIAIYATGAFFAYAIVPILRWLEK